jgi:hypothetical protein
MAFRARDGRAFGRRDQMNAYNDRISRGSSGTSRPQDAEDEREGHERKEYGGSLEPKPHQPPEEVETQQRRGENPARNPNPGPREPRPNTPTPGIEQAGDSNNPGEAGGADDISYMNINDAVRNHGPADNVQIRSSGGMHHVTTSHGGRRHVSTHPTPQGAALHAADAMGLNQHVANLAGNPRPEDSIPGMRRSGY